MVGGDDGREDAADEGVVEQTSSRARVIPPERLIEVERRLLSAQSPRRIAAELAEAWDITRRQVQTYVSIVRKRLAAQAAQRDPATDGEIAREMLLNAYRVAEIGGESGPMPSAMVQAARVYAEITGALKPAKVDITSGGKPLQSLTEDELRARVAERLAALEALRTRGA